MQHTSDKRGNDAKAGTSLIYGLNICSIGANHTLRFEQATPENLSGLTHNMGLFYILGTALGGGGREQVGSINAQGHSRPDFFHPLSLQFLGPRIPLVNRPYSTGQ